MKEKKKMGLGVRILLGMVLGIIVGAILWALLGVDKANEIATAYIKPFGDIFVNLLKYIVVPLVLLSIMDGVISMGDIGKVGKMRQRTPTSSTPSRAFSRRTSSSRCSILPCSRSS